MITEKTSRKIKRNCKDQEKEQNPDLRQDKKSPHLTVKRLKTHYLLYFVLIIRTSQIIDSSSLKLILINFRAFKRESSCCKPYFKHISGKMSQKGYF